MSHAPSGCGNTFIPWIIAEGHSRDHWKPPEARSPCVEVSFEQREAEKDPKVRGTCPVGPSTFLGWAIYNVGQSFLPWGGGQPCHLNSYFKR